MNEHTLIGNLTRDPQLHASRTTQRPVATFDLAVNRRRLDRSSREYVDQALVFHRVVCYGPLADHMAQSLRRGVESWWLAASSTTATTRTASGNGGSPWRPT
jgi:single-strand DNA-binding protein